MTGRREAEKTDDSHPHDGRGRSAAGPGALRSAWLPDGIRARLFLLIGLTLLPVLVLQGWIYYEHYQWRQNQALRMELEVAGGVARTFQTYIDGIRRQLDTVGETILAFMPYTRTKAEHLLAVVVRRYPAMRTVNWVDPEGIILASNVSRGVGHDLSGRRYFQQIVAGRTWALGDLTPQGAFTQSPTVAMGVALRNDRGELLGVVVASFEPTRLEEVPFTPPHDADSTWTLFDSQGQLVFRNPEIPLTWERRIGWLQDDPLLQKALAGQVGLGKMKPVLGGGMRFVARVPIGDTGWAAGASRQVSVVATAVRRSLFQEVGLGLLVTLLAFSLAYLIARTLAGPLYRLEHDARALGAGSFELSADPQAPAEVRSLRGTVARMARDLIERAEAIRLSEAILSQAGKIANLGAWQIEFSSRENLRENPLRWSDEVYRIFGLPRGTPVTYDTFLDAVHPDDRAHVDAGWVAALHGEIYDVEHRIVVGDVIKWVRERAEMEFDDRGVLLRAFGAVQDITDRKRVEDELRLTEARFRTLFEQSPLSIHVLAPDGRTIEVNHAWQRLWSATPQDLAGWNIFHDRRIEAQGVMPYIRRGFAGEPAETPVFVYDPAEAGQPGRPRSLKAYVYPVKDEAGHIVQVVLMHVEVTELVETEKALRESEERLSLAIDATGLGAFDFDPHTGELLWSRSVRQHFGLSSDAHINYDVFLSGLHPDDRERTNQLVQRALTPLGGGKFHADYRTIGIEDRVERWIHAEGRVFFDEQGSPVRFIGATLDITEPKKAEEALRRSEESLRELTRTLEMKVSQRTQQLEYRARQLQKLTLELSQAEDRERKRLAEILHDDLQQQLAAAKFHLGLLFTRARGDESLRVAVARLDGMLKDAIETSRGLSHELSPALLYDDDLGATFEWLAGQIQAKHGLIVHVHADGEVESKSDALKAFLYKAAQEMLFNVVKHARVGQAAMRIRRTGRCLCLVVSDHGRGFDPQELKAATGFGLFSIRERVQLLGGRMKIKSARGKGCTLFIAVPDGEPAAGSMLAVVANPPAGAEVALPGAAEPGPQKRLRVLVADDHEVVRNGLSALLAGEPDIEIVGEAANGREAVDLAYELEPDIVIMDVAMPVISGDEATRQIKLHLHHTRVIALSMYEEAGIVEKMYRAGAETYVCKTAPSDELLAAVRNRPPGPAVEQLDETKASSPA